MTQIFNFDSDEAGKKKKSKGLSDSRIKKPTSINISLLSFADFITKTDNAKLTFVSSLKNRSENPQGYDYWSKLKFAIRKYHKGIITLEELKDLQNQVRSDKKENFRRVCEDYIHLIKGMEVGWFNPPTLQWIQNDVGIRITSHLGFIYKNQKVLVVLYTRKDALNKKKATAMITLMQNVLQASNMEYKILLFDIQARITYTEQNSDESIMPFLRREVIYFENVWNKA